MSLASSARASSQLTNAAYKLVPAVEVEPLDTGNYAINGSCGHRLTVVRPGRDVEAWEAKIAAGRRHRRRCDSCIQDPDAHAAKLVLGW